MFVYYLDLAWRRLRRDAGLSALMVIAIGFGVAATMTTYAVFRAVTGDPIPGKSSRLFVPQIDGTGPEVHHDAEPDEALTYIDAMALMRAHRAKRQSAHPSTSRCHHEGDHDSHVRTSSPFRLAEKRQCTVACRCRTRAA